MCQDVRRQREERVDKWRQVRLSCSLVLRGEQWLQEEDIEERVEMDEVMDRQ